MARRGYNGVLTHVIVDITRREDFYTLINAGASWQCISKLDTETAVLNNTEAIEERDVYRQWYDSFLLELEEGEA